MRDCLLLRQIARSIILLIASSLSFASLTASAIDRYQIDPNHTHVIFEYSHWGLSLQNGRFDKNSGFIELDLENKTGIVHIEVDAASISTGISLFDNKLRSDDFFDVVPYPKIIFKSTSLQFDEQNNVIGIEGELTIKTVTRAVKFQLTHFNCRFMPLYLKSACGANGYTRIQRSDFDMARYTPFVSDEVTLYFSVEAIRE